MNSELLNISPRLSTDKAKKLRRQGYIPGVLYGYNQASTPVLFDKQDVERFLFQKGENRVFEISLNGEIQPVRIREVQREPVSQEITHIDLQQVQMDKKIKMAIPVVFEGKEMIEKSGSILQHQKNAVEIEGYAKDMPTQIRIPLHLLQRNQSIKVQDLEVAAELSIIDAPNELIASIIRPTREELPEPKSVPAVRDSSVE